MIRIFLSIALLYLTGCATITKPQSQGESESGFTYIPIDPFSVETKPGDSCIKTDSSTEPTPPEGRSYKALLDAFPDNAVRVAIEQLGVSGKITYGTSFVAAKNEQYKVTVDYINSDTTNIAFWISKKMQIYGTEKYETVPLLAPNNGKYTYDSEMYTVTRSKPNGEDAFFYAEYNVPVYIGVGLRVTANVKQVSSDANISGLGVIGAEAEANKIQGTLVVQTLGINGKSIAAALPIQSELNRTTAQNAVVAVGSIKALLYENETVKSPRVVGLYLPFPGGRPLVNAIISELSKERVPWPRPCNFEDINRRTKTP